MFANQLTTVNIRPPQLARLKAIGLELSAPGGRQMALHEVIDRLLSAWSSRPGGSGGE